MLGRLVEAAGQWLDLLDGMPPFITGRAGQRGAVAPEFAVAGRAMSYDPDVFRAVVETAGCLATPQEVFTRPGAWEKVTSTPDEPLAMPGPTRAELLAPSPDQPRRVTPITSRRLGVVAPRPSEDGYDRPKRSLRLVMTDPSTGER